MTVESDLYAALQSLVAGRVYPDVAPDGATTPYITYQQIGGKSTQYLESTLPDKKNGRFQVNVWATTRTSASALVLQVEAAIVGSMAFQSEAIGAHVSDYEPDTKLFGAMQDFSIWSAR